LINIVICIDKYLQDKIYPCYNSILQNTKEPVQFYNFCLDNVDNSAMEKYRSMGMQVHKIQTDLRIKLHDNFVKSPAMYLRFYIPEILDIDRAIYTECDSVYNCDIKDHWNIDIGDNYCGMSEDWFSKTCGKLKRWSGNIDGFDDTPSYLTGNMIINCKEWRKNNITNELVTIVNKNNIRVNLSMSIVCRNNIFKLDDKWCLPASHKELGDTEGIYHWSGNKKPWLVKVKNQEVWEKYL
jgi:lipopolysaccharide biosynthesis glycosyltransferase